MQKKTKLTVNAKVLTRGEKMLQNALWVSEDVQHLINIFIRQQSNMIL